MKTSCYNPNVVILIRFCYVRSIVNANLVCNALVVFYVLAEIHGWIPDAILVVEATAALLRVFVLCNGNLIPGELRSNKLKQEKKHLHKMSRYNY